MTTDFLQTADVLKRGGVAVIPTDTQYGVVAVWNRPEAVEKLYSLKQRSTDKPCIILISGFDDLALFGLQISEADKQIISTVWPGPVSVILPCDGQEFSYLHRGTNRLAFRWPNHDGLIGLIREVGPIVAPSANPEGEPPAVNVSMARNYFGDQVDVYADGGELIGAPSTLVALNDGQLIVLRPGQGQIPIY